MSINSKMTAIADAIRGKTGKTTSLTLDDMAIEINGIKVIDELLGYSYNGFILPALPTWDTTTYPYLTIFTDFEPTYYEFGKQYSGRIQDCHSFIVYATAQPFTMRPYFSTTESFPHGYDIPYIELNNAVNISCLQTEINSIYKESFPIMNENVITNKQLTTLKPVWANYNLKHQYIDFISQQWNDDSVYLTTTEPVPVWNTLNNSLYNNVLCAKVGTAQLVNNTLEIV